MQPLEIDLRKTIVRCGNKRSRQASVASSSALEDELSDSDDEDDLSPPVRKKVKAAVGTRTTVKVTHQKPKPVMRAKPRCKVATGLRSASPKAKHVNDSVSERKPVMASGEQHPFALPYNAAQMQPGMMGSAATTPVNMSFNSNMSDVSFDQPLNTPTSPLPDNSLAMPGLPYQPQNYSQSGFHVRPVHQVPQPQFDTVPNTPTFLANELLPFEQQNLQFTDQMVVETPAATGPQDFTPAQSYSMTQAMHGLPSNNRLPHHGQWLEAIPFAYAVPQGMQAAYAPRAGFVVDPSNGPTPRGWATNPYQGPPHTYDNDMSYDHPFYGPNHELPPPATLPDDVERGFTGHASGVGDSACPPGYGPPYFA